MPLSKTKLLWYFLGVLYDFHTHTFHSDGILSPIELIRRALVRGYSAIALTDHVALGSLDRLIKETSDDCALARTYWDILAIPGVELTHIPPSAISEVAKRAKEMGAWLVVVHGETSAEPVEEGTNLAAVKSPYVDILAHPLGRIVGKRPPYPVNLDELIMAAKQHEVILEINAFERLDLPDTAARVAKENGVKLAINTDAHHTSQLDAMIYGVAMARRGWVEASSVINTQPLEKLEKTLKHIH